MVLKGTYGEKIHKGKKTRQVSFSFYRVMKIKLDENIAFWEGTIVVVVD